MNNFLGNRRQRAKRKNTGNTVSNAPLAKWTRYRRQKVRSTRTSHVHNLSYGHSLNQFPLNLGQDRTRLWEQSNWLFIVNHATLYLYLSSERTNELLCFACRDSRFLVLVNQCGRTGQESMTIIRANYLYISIPSTCLFFLFIGKIIASLTSKILSHIGWNQYNAIHSKRSQLLRLIAIIGKYALPKKRVFWYISVSQFVFKHSVEYQYIY